MVFLDGVGLGVDDPAVNPLAGAEMPVLRALLGGVSLTASTGAVQGNMASLIPTDACLGMPRKPQSASGQAALVTGLNVPQMIGEHYGPRPNAAIRTILNGETLFTKALAVGRSVAFANAYPQGYFDAVNWGKRLHGAIPFAVTAAGIRLRTSEDLLARRALSIDLTNQGWQRDLGYADMPLLTPRQAGAVLAQLTADHDLTFFDNWLTDVVGHRNNMETALATLSELDSFFGGLAEGVDLENTLILITSDHGNLEDVTTSRPHPEPGADHSHRQRASCSC